MSALRLSVDVDQCDGSGFCASCNTNNPAANSQQVLDAENRSAGHEPGIVTSIARSPARRTIESYERELAQYRIMEIRLRDALAESEERLRQNLSASTVIPLGFIASELVTNAAKYGKSRIVIRLHPDPEFGYALSVSNDGPALPEGFDPGASKGLGMRVIQAFAKQIDGALRVGRDDDGQGARFTVPFPLVPVTGGSKS